MGGRGAREPRRESESLSARTSGRTPPAHRAVVPSVRVREAEQGAGGTHGPPEAGRARVVARAEPVRARGVRGRLRVDCGPRLMRSTGGSAGEPGSIAEIWPAAAPYQRKRQTPSFIELSIDSTH